MLKVPNPSDAPVCPTDASKPHDSLLQPIQPERRRRWYTQLSQTVPEIFVFSRHVPRRPDNLTSHQADPELRMRIAPHPLPR